MSVWKAIKWILLLPLILAGLGIAYCEANKAYWDHRVRELCKKDGGVTVFETIAISNEEFRLLPNVGGVVTLPSIGTENENHHYFEKSKTTILHRSNPYVWRTDVVIVMRDSDRVMAKYATFHRRGGDFPSGVSHESAFGCPDPLTTLTDLRKIFSIHGE